MSRRKILGLAAAAAGGGAVASTDKESVRDTINRALQEASENVENASEDNRRNAANLTYLGAAGLAGRGAYKAFKNLGKTAKAIAGGKRAPSHRLNRSTMKRVGGYELGGSAVLTTGASAVHPGRKRDY